MSHTDVKSHALIKNERAFILILTMIQFTHILDFVIMMPLGPQMMRIFNISPSQFSFMVSAYTFAASIFGFLSAFVIDRFDRKWTLNLVYSGFIIGTLVCAFAPNYSILILGRIIAGAFGGIIGGLVFSIIGDTIPFSRRGSATGKIMSAFSIASVVGVPIGLQVATMFSWHAPFLMLACLSFFILLISSIYIPNLNMHLIDRKPTNDLDEVFKVFTVKNHLWAFLLVTVLMFSSFALIPFISPVMVFNAGLAEKDLTYIYLVGGIFTFFSARLVGKFADRYGKARLFTVIAVLSVIPLTFLTHIPRVSFPVAIATTTLFMMFTSGRFIPAMALITATSSTQMRGRFMSINSCVQQMASGLAAFVAGLIITHGENNEILNYDIVGYIGVISIICSLFIIRKIEIMDS
ncbi:MAG: MFS transporter [Bacteriovoracaceae bacterium]